MPWSMSVEHCGISWLRRDVGKGGENMVTELRKASIWDLRQTDLLAGLSDWALAKIMGICREDVFGPGDIIFTEGTDAEDVHLLLEGQVVLEIQINAVQRRVTTTVDTVNRGHIFGWSALVEPHVLTASARCTQAARVALMNGTALLGIFKEYPEIGYAVMKNLSGIISSRLTATRLGLQREIRQLYLLNW